MGKPPSRREVAQQVARDLGLKPEKTCDGCTACCHIVPNAEIGLPAFTACRHERRAPFASPGCGIYAERPASCRLWHCQYLLEAWDDELRPDRCGVVVDPLPDLIRLRPPDVTKGTAPLRPAVQMWAAAGYERAFERQPVLALVMASIERIGAVVWRYRGPDGEQMAVGLSKHEGEFFATAPAAVDPGFSASMTTGERLIRAQQLLAQNQRGIG